MPHEEPEAKPGLCKGDYRDGMGMSTVAVGETVCGVCGGL